MTWVFPPETYRMMGLRERVISRPISMSGGAPAREVFRRGLEDNVRVNGGGARGEITHGRRSG
jgi:hypothetical protein